MTVIIIVLAIISTGTDNTLLNWISAWRHPAHIPKMKTDGIRNMQWDEQTGCEQAES